MRSVLNKSKQKLKIQSITTIKNNPQQIPQQTIKEYKEGWTQTLEPFITKKSSDNDTSKEYDCDLNLIQQNVSSIAATTEKEYRYGQQSPQCNCQIKSQKGNSINSQNDSRLINWRQLSFKIKDLEEQIVQISMKYQKRETHLINELEQKRIKWILKYNELKKDAENMKEFYEKGKSVWKFYLTTLHDALTAFQSFQQEQNAKNNQMLQQVVSDINEINNFINSNQYNNSINTKGILNESQFQYTNRFDSLPTSCSRNLDQTSNQLNSNNQLYHFNQNSNNQINVTQNSPNFLQICSKIKSSIQKVDEIQQSFNLNSSTKKYNKFWTHQQIQIMERIELLLRQNQKISFISSTPEQSSMVASVQEGSSMKKQFFEQKQQSNVLTQIIKNNIQVQDSQIKQQKKKDSTSPIRNDFFSQAALYSPRTLKREVDGSYQFQVSNIDDDDEIDKKSESTQKEFIVNEESLIQEVQKRKSFSSQKKLEIEQRYSKDICIIRRLFQDVSTSLHLSDQLSNSCGNKYEESILIKNSPTLADDGLLLQSQNLQNGLQTPLKSNNKNQNGNNNNANSSASQLLKNNQLIQSVQSMIVPSFYTISDAKSHLQTQRILNNIHTLQKSDVDNNNLTYSQDEDGSIQNYSNLINSRKSTNPIPNLQYDSIFTNPIIQSDTKQNAIHKFDEKFSNLFQIQTSLKGLKQKTLHLDNYQNNSKVVDDSRSELTIKEDYSNSNYKNQNKQYF